MAPSLRTEFDDTEPVPRYSPGGRRTDDSGNGTRVTLVMASYVGIVLTLASLIFTAGFNWHRITVVEEKHESLAVQVAQDYVRKDVVGAQLEEIKVQLAALQRAAERAADRTVPR